MADQNLNPVGCLGRVLTTIGFVWMGIVVLGGLGVLSEMGMSGGFIAAIAGTFFPAVILIIIGRALNRRARTMAGQGPPVLDLPSPKSRVPSIRKETSVPTVTPPILPDSATSKSPPPATRPAPRRVDPLQVPRQRDPLPPPRESAPPVELEEVIPPPPVSEPAAARPDPPPPLDESKDAPKSSREMIEEARAKWGTRKKG